MAEKIKNNPDLFEVLEPELRPDERILWVGQPDPFCLFVRQDVMLIPVGLVFAIVGMVIVTSPFSLQSGSFLLGLPHLLFGLFVFVGRFVYKFWRKQHTYYAVTSTRLLIVYRTFGNELEAHWIANLRTLRQQAGWDGIGKIVFGEPQIGLGQRQDFSNTGMEVFGYTVPGFYDIANVNEVYALINELRYDIQNPVDEDEQIIRVAKAKRGS